MTTVAFVGAGSVVFTRQLLADILGFPELEGVTISLHDIDRDRLSTAEGIAHQVAAQLGGRPTITCSTDRRAALDGADFVINMVQVGGIGATRVDFEVPASFGLRQTIADTLGVGGVFRALRTFPVLQGIAEDMQAVCPDAWLLNYTNPMAMNIWWLSEVAPSVKAVGLCHSVYWTVAGLCDVVGVPLEGTSYRAAGVNHQAWLMRWEYDGQDLYPRLDAAIAADEQLRRRVRVDMYRRLGYYPTETSEHSSEYVSWYLHDQREVERLRIPVDVYLGISEENVAEYEATRRALAAGEQLTFETSATEYAPQVIHSIVTGTPRSIHANVVNRGLIANLRQGAAVEVPCTVDALGLHPQAVGELPAQCAALNSAFLAVCELTVRAGLEGDPRLVRQAVMMDPNASASLRVEEIWDLCDAMTRAHGDLLPEALRARSGRSSSAPWQRQTDRGVRRRRSVGDAVRHRGASSGDRAPARVIELVEITSGSRRARPAGGRAPGLDGLDRTGFGSASTSWPTVSPTERLCHNASFDARSGSRARSAAMIPSCSACEVASRFGTSRKTRWNPEWRCQMSIVRSRSISLPQAATIVRWNSLLRSENEGPSCASTAARMRSMSASRASSSASETRSAASPVAMLSRCDRMK